MLNRIKVILVLVHAGMGNLHHVDFQLQLPFQLLVVLLCTPDVLIFCGIGGLTHHMGGAAEQNRARRERRQHKEQQHRQHTADHQQMCMAFCKGGRAFGYAAYYLFALRDYTVHT